MVAFDDFGRAPLLYHQGAYSSVLPHPRLVKKSESVGKTAFQGRLSHNLYYLMTQAVRSYQTDYQPRQLTTGLRTSEARMLMVLEKDACLGIADLLQLVAMPAREIEEAMENLKRKGLVVDSEHGYAVSAAGIDQAEVLWHIADAQQEKVFARYAPEQVEAFKTILKDVIALG